MAETTSLSEIDTASLLKIADLLIPGGAGLPPASGTSSYLDAVTRICSIRPDFVAPMRDLSARFAESPAETVDAIRAEGEESFLAITELVAGAYFLDAGVIATLDYIDRPTIPLDEENERVSALQKLVEPVIRIGNTARTTV